MEKGLADFYELVDEVLKLKTRKRAEDFLRGILTPQEMREIPKRLMIVKMLKRGVAQHDVARELKVGIATVTRGSKELKLGRFKYI